MVVAHQRVPVAARSASASTSLRAAQLAGAPEHQADPRSLDNKRPVVIEYFISPNVPENYAPDAAESAYRAPRAASAAGGDKIQVIRHNVEPFKRGGGPRAEKQFGSRPVPDRIADCRCADARGRSSWAWPSPAGSTRSSSRSSSAAFRSSMSWCARSRPSASKSARRSAC